MENLRNFIIFSFKLIFKNSEKSSTIPRARQTDHINFLCECDKKTNKCISRKSGSGVNVVDKFQWFFHLLIALPKEFSDTKKRVQKSSVDDEVFRHFHGKCLATVWSVLKMSKLLLCRLTLFVFFFFASCHAQWKFTSRDGAEWTVHEIAGCARHLQRSFTSPSSFSSSRRDEESVQLETGAARALEWRRELQKQKKS